MQPIDSLIGKPYHQEYNNTLGLSAMQQIAQTMKVSFLRVESKSQRLILFWFPHLCCPHGLKEATFLVCPVGMNPSYSLLIASPIDANVPSNIFHFIPILF